MVRKKMNKREYRLSMSKYKYKKKIDLSSRMMKKFHLKKNPIQKNT